MIKLTTHDSPTAHGAAGSTGPDAETRALRAMHDALAAMPTCNVVVAGKAGVGKSTLLNAVFGHEVAATGSGRSVTKRIRRHALPGTQVAIFDAPGVELGRNVEELIADYETEIDRRARRSQGEYLHMLWYCVRTDSRRFEDFEARFLEALAPRVTTILVLTQCLDATEPSMEAFRGHLASRGLPVSGIVPTLAMPRVLGAVTVPTHGLTELVGLTLQNLPTATHRAFVNAQRVAVDDKAEEARTYAEQRLSEIHSRWRRLKRASENSVAVDDRTCNQILDTLAGIAAIFGEPSGAARALKALVPLTVGAPKDMATPGMAMVASRSMTQIMQRRQMGVPLRDPRGVLAMINLAIVGGMAARDSWIHHKVALEVTKQLRLGVLAAIPVFRETALSKAQGHKLSDQAIQGAYARQLRAQTEE